MSDLKLTHVRVKDFALADIDKILRDNNGQLFRDFPPMPLPTSLEIERSSNLLIVKE